MQGASQKSCIAYLNTRNNMVIAKGKIVTSDIKFCKYNEQTRKYDIVFNNGKQFSYNFNNVVFLKAPEVLNVSLYKVEHLGKELFDISAIYVCLKTDNFCLLLRLKKHLSLNLRLKYQQKKKLK